MKAGYEEKFMEIQGELVSLCMEAVEGFDVKKIFMYEFMSEGGNAYNAFCEVGGEPKFLNEMGVDKKNVRTLLHAGTVEMMDKIRKLCKEFEATRPTEIKAVYDVETGGFEMNCEYDAIDVCSAEALEIWMDEINAAKAAGTQA